MPNDETLDAYIALADDLCTATKAHIERSMAVLRERGYVLKVRDEVILALGLKIDSAFRALIDDARRRRTEAAHHLKTIVEAFIFMFVVAKDETDFTAKRVLAEVSEQKVRYLRLNPDSDTPTGENQEVWAQELRDYQAANVPPIGALANAATGHSPELATWYNAAYRIACEAAHIADLFDFMPSLDLDHPMAGTLRMGALRAQSAVNHGLLAMIHTLRLANDNELGLSLDLTPFEERLRALDAARRTT
jgi:hypothetical protein